MSVFQPNTASQLRELSHILRLRPYQPGKPIEEVKRELGLTDIVKLASNENPLGPSPFAIEAMKEAAARVALYPDGACHDLREVVASHLGIPGDHLIFGNGSDEIIHLLGLVYLQSGDTMIQADPSFVCYESSAVLNDANCIKVPLVAWTHDLGAMASQVDHRTRLVYVTNCNNPTGTIVTHAELTAFLDAMPPHVLTVIDEAYYEYAQHPDYPRSLEFVREGRNVMVLRTFSKAYGLAGLRLGYGIARPEIVAYVNQAREPFNVNLLAQAAGVAAIRDQEHVRRSIEVNIAGKQTLESAFDSLGMEYAPTEGNFVWVNVKRRARATFEALLRRGVIVRSGEIFGFPTHLRITIGTASQNDRFLSAMNEILAGEEVSP